ncbi:lipase maturation factor 2-like [Neocloeon triangulifer]|uniref:lipase maturation factor 2-like n=1 Tax=Neocloeon triangulifer TaxID=2078957 RepID=UPI00286F98A2|nr:lipase maturation factor 2-like [Neocloeon triangulifer]
MAATLLPPVRYTRNLFLRCVSAIYLIAFLSIYVQIPGLNGSNGILPAKSQLESSRSRSLLEQIYAKPTLVWLAPLLGLDTEHALELIALLGSFLAFLGTVSQKACISPTFLLLWISYLSLFQVNPVFMGHQSDKLLLETGFLCVLLAPFLPKDTKKEAAKDAVVLWMVKWLLFRLMFSTCIVKFTTKGSRLWWQLAGLDVYFEVQWLPNYLSWYSHHLPQWFLHLSTLYTHFTEVVVPFFFFVPFHLASVIAFYFQIFLQLCILFTGNFGILNLLICILCISLLDDRNFLEGPSKNSPPKYSQVSKMASLALYGLSFVLAFKALGFGPKGLEVQGSDEKGVEEFLRWFAPLFPGIAVVAFCVECGKRVTKLLLQSDGCKDKILPLFILVLHILACIAVIGLSAVSFSSMRPPSAKEPQMLTALRPIYSKAHKWHITSSYSMYLQIDEKGERKEVILEGSNSLKGPWIEYNFRYKPGNVNRSLPIIVPHQPRLDWQMWYTGISTYQHNPWILSLAYRLLQGQHDVLQLLDPYNPFQLPPKYIRASLYTYKFTPWSENKFGSAWWTRVRKADYFPIYSVDHPPLLDFLKQHKVLGAKDWPLRSHWLASLLEMIRTKLDPSVFTWSILMAAFALVMSGTR